MNIPLKVFPLLLKLLRYKNQGLVLVELLLCGALLLRVLVLVGGSIFEAVHASQRPDPISFGVEEAVTIKLGKKFF